MTINENKWVPDTTVVNKEFWFYGNDFFFDLLL